jgi:serine/threonine-protein kinase
VGERARDTFSRITSIVLMVAILIVAGGISAITAMRLAIQGKEVSVPQLVGKTEAEAAEILNTSGLSLQILGKRFNPKTPAGRIIEQNPAPGTSLKTSRSVRVLLSAGNRQYAVPNLVGASRRAAQLTLSQRDLVLGHVSMVHTASGEPFTVQQQFPLPGSQEGADPKVNVLLSAGSLEQYFVMPDLVGRRWDQVSGRIRTQGFQLARPTYRHYVAVSPGVVTQQSPQAGKRLSKADLITLEVSQ